MKNLCLSVAMLFSVSLLSQSIILSTQAEVDNFNETSVQDGLIIGNSFGSQYTDINNLQNLSGLTFIGGALTIRYNNLLTSLEGLDNVTATGGGLSIKYNDNLMSFEGLDNLTTIGGDFEIRFNGSITSLNGLGSLTTIGGRFWINNNGSMTDPTGMTNLNSIGSFRFSSTPLTDLRFLQNITSMYSLRFSFLPVGLENFMGLENLITVEQTFSVRHTTTIVNFVGLENLTTVGDLQIGGYYYDDYKEVNFYEPNTSIASLDGLNNLESILGDFSIVRADSLEDLTALSNLTSIGGDVEIAYNHSLLNLNGLNDTGINGRLDIHDNSSLSVCNAPAVCNHFDSGGPGYVLTNAPGCNSTTQIVDACTTLPVEILEPLHVYLDNRIVILKWKTTTENNNTGFEIQRSKYGINWEKIGWHNGQGTSNTPHSYTYRDANPYSGMSYYRLKQIDFDSQFEYSNIVSVRYHKLEGITIYPVPATDFVVFDVPNVVAATEIILYDITGKEISRQTFPQDKKLAISHLKDGVYIYRIFYNNEMYSGKIVTRASSSQ